MTKTTYCATTAPPSHPRPPLTRGKRRDARAAVRCSPPTVIAPPLGGKPSVARGASVGHAPQTRGWRETASVWPAEGTRVVGCVAKRCTKTRGKQRGRSTTGATIRPRNPPDYRGGHLGNGNTTGYRRGITRGRQGGHGAQTRGTGTGQTIVDRAGRRGRRSGIRRNRPAMRRTGHTGATGPPYRPWYRQRATAGRQGRRSWTGQGSADNARHGATQGRQRHARG